MKETEIKVMNDDETRDFCIRKDYEIFKKEKEIERLNNIIKEVREYIEPIVELDNDIMLKGKMLKPVLEILDKRSSNGSN